ncbi:MAG: hypothetical protein EOP37_22270 [Rubrivivax sp.]|nr:MAG: hypothetical protein EOP37_22270 [Rubrivivax sp.]
MATTDIQVLGPFRLFRNERLLTLAGRPVPLPAGAVDLLLELVDQAGVEVSERDLDEVLRRADPARRSSLLAICEALNIALSAGSSSHFIAQVDDQRFVFLGDVRDVAQDLAPSPENGTSSFAALPSLDAELVCRDELVTRILDRLQGSRLVSLVGPGGVGKTTVAVLAAARRARDGQAPVCFVDLAAVQRPGAVAEAVLLSLGWEPPASPSEGRPAIDDCLHGALLGRSVLLVLDNCEHLVAEVAAVVDIVLRSQGASVLATSREPLNTFGEVVVPVGPLALPESAPHTLGEARAYSAVDLFVVRAAGRGVSTASLSVDLPLVCEVCRRLDGIPLALELAAAHVPALGMDGLLERLTSWPVASLGSGGSGGDRGGEADAGVEARALRRHRTLEAAFDWSYALLSPAEQTALVRLSIFRGDFPFESALRVIAVDGEDPTQAADSLFGLQARSLIAVNLARGRVQYRLLETTREYAAEKLRTAPGRSKVRRQHALDCMERLERAERDWSLMNGKGWLARYGRLIDDVTLATAWSLGNGRDGDHDGDGDGDVDMDVEVGIDLVLRGLPMASRLGRFDEAIEQMAAALQALEDRARGRFPRQELQLLVSLRTMGLNSKRQVRHLPESDARVLELVDQLGDARDAFGACMSVWTTSAARADFAAAVAAARRLLALAEGSTVKTDVVDAAKHAAYAFHFSGDLRQGAAQALRVLELMPDHLSPSYYNVAQIDARVSARIVLARTRWMCGAYDQASRTADQALALALEDRPVAVCLVLSFALCPIALWNGDAEAARRHLDMLQACAATAGIALYAEWARWYEAVLDGTAADHAPQGADAWPEPYDMLSDMLATTGCSWLLPRVSRRVASGVVGWCDAEVARAEGQALLTSGELTAARGRFEDAIRLARASTARAWEFRACLSLAELEASQGHPAAAAALLEPFEAICRGAFQNADTVRARALLRASTQAAADA